MDDLDIGVAGDGFEMGVESEGREADACIRDVLESKETDDGGDIFGGAGGGDSGRGGGNVSCGKMNDDDADLASFLLRRASFLLFLVLPFKDQ